MIRVTVAIPTYKRSTLLERALLSALAQTFAGGMEVLVLENPSEESLPGVPTFAERLCDSMADTRLRYVRNATNLGMVGNWNRCLDLARSQWVIILHDDDWLSPHFLELALALTDANPELRLVGCKGIIEREGVEVRPDPRPTSSVKYLRIAPFHILLGNPFLAPGVMMDKETALALGGFDPDWFPTMDHMFWLRFCEAVPCARLQFPLLHYYIGNNASLQSDILVRYILNDWKQRAQLLSRHYPKNRLLRLYSRIKVYREHVFLEHLFKQSLSYDELAEGLTKLGWRPVSIYLRWTYFPLRCVLETISIFFKSCTMKPVKLLK